MENIILQIKAEKQKKLYYRRDMFCIICTITFIISYSYANFAYYCYINYCSASVHGKKNKTNKRKNY